MLLEDKIMDFAERLAINKIYDESLAYVLDIDDKYQIQANHQKIENDECVYLLTLYNKADEIEVDSIFCDIEKEQIEDMICFFVEEYTLK